MLALGLGDQVRGFVVQLPEHAQGTHIGLLGARAEAIELQDIGSFLLPIGHHGVSPVLECSQWSRDATRIRRPEDDRWAIGTRVWRQRKR